MKVATLNCNGFQACVRKGFFDWLRDTDPDILCLQEVRFAQDRLIEKFQPPEQWHWAQVDAQKAGYSSVAIWSKKSPLKVHRTIGLDWADNEGRVVGMEFEKCIVWSMYFPSGTSGQARQDLKDDFLAHLTPWMSTALTGEKAVIVCGDVNIAHTALDIFHDKANKNKSEKNVGWRIDYQLISPHWGEPTLAAIHKEPKLSDHAPVVVEYDMDLQ